MEKTEFEEWFKQLGNAWCARDPEKAASLFSKNVEYYESVFEPPCNWDKVLELWLAVPKNQKDITYDFEIISTAGNLAVCNWKVSRTMLPDNKLQRINGIFIIRLNQAGLCDYFKQWRSVH
ncbi:MAG: nuclear transport factor 2 family protein [Candidatus Micrarchaeia archaeon]